MERSAKSILAAALVAVLTAGVSCRPTKGPVEKVYRRDQQAQVGPLIYTVSDVAWREQLGDAAETRTPEHRFLLLRLSVTNSGIVPAPIPSAELVDLAGKRYAELADGRGVADWMGAVRTVEPAQTEHGVLLFDAPVGDYRLRVRHQPELDEGTSALIEVRYQPGAGS